jgi:radical SAM superfamily enzyme YgiQ (UPF0313 family)
LSQKANKKNIGKDNFSESGAAYKDPGGRLNVALVWPGSYRIGMSSLGFLSVYSLINSSERGLCERFFLPEMGDRLLSKESKRAINSFEIIAGSLSIENDYYLFLKVLELGGIPVVSNLRCDLSSFRGLVAVGGIGPWSNPYPFMPFVDFILTGEGEITWPRIMDLYEEEDFYKLSKEEKLLLLEREVPGIIVPSLLPEELTKENTYSLSFKNALSKFTPIRPSRLIFPSSKENTQFLPPGSPVFTLNTEFSGMKLVEISRGCPYGCRFCLAGSMYRPHRFWELDNILKAIVAPNPWDKKNVSSFPEDSPVGLISPSVADHPKLLDLIDILIAEKRKISFSSIRLSALNEDMARLFGTGKLLGLACAPEAGTDKMRKIINKDLSEDEILSAIKLLSKVSLRKLKLYFMLGLPEETDDDLEGIVTLIEKIQKASFGKTKAPFLSVSLSNFTPKPHTPFEDTPLLTITELKRKGNVISNLMKRVKGVELKLDSPMYSIIQGLIGRSGTEGASLLLELLKNNGKPKNALKSWGYEERKKEIALSIEARPWRIVAPPMGTKFLEEEKIKSHNILFTDKCPVKNACGRCGACTDFIQQV